MTLLFIYLFFIVRGIGVTAINKKDTGRRCVVSVLCYVFSTQ